MKITHVVSGFNGGGVYTSVKQLVEHQVAEGHRVIVVRDARSDIIDQSGGDFSRQDYPSETLFYTWAAPREISIVKDLQALFQLWRLLKSDRPDIVHLHCAKAGLLGRLVCRALRLPVVYSPRGLSFYRTDVSAFLRHTYFLLEFAATRLGGIIVACSPGELAGVKRLKGRNALIFNGVDLARIDRERTTTAASAGAFTIMTLGRITYARNPELVAEISLESPRDWQWKWVGGDGGLSHVLDDHPRVQISGWLPRNEAVARLRSAQVLLHPSKWEGMPMAVLEAMALGLPVIASNIVGNADLIVDGETGFLIDIVPDYLPTLQRLADNPALRQAMGQRGRQRIEDHFSILALAPKWITLYNSEIARWARSG